MFSQDANIKAKVIDDRRVDFNGEIVYLAPITQRLLGYARPVQGALYWSYENETLDERRKRMETED